jgi:hypothetical protein
MTNPVTTILTIAVHSPNSNPVYGAGTLHVSLDDEAGGVYITIKELSDGSEQGVVRIDPDEVPIVFETAMKLLAQQTLKENLTND